MKELFDSLWKVAPRLMSVIVIFSIIFYGAWEIAKFQQRVENIENRLGKLEIRMDRLEERMDRVEQKLDKVIQYLLEDRANQDRREKSGN